MILSNFEPTVAGAKQRLHAIQPFHYAKTRNALDGAVTRLSPYITHGILTVPQAIAYLLSKHRLNFDDKIIFEFAWREFFHHAWNHLGDAILSDVREPCWLGKYSNLVPPDVIAGTTGVGAIDQAVKELYANGYLHNHARMWIASYLVHLRKVHWRAGAEWMYSHLLDGDLASNHLSWQWVAATFSSKPYLFNAANVQKFAAEPWHCAGTVVDNDYAALEETARTKSDCGPEPEHRRKFSTIQTQPEVFGEPPPALLDELFAQGWKRVNASDAPKEGIVRLVHPWSLGDSRIQRQRVGLIHLPFHAKHPWSAARWSFVLRRMREVTDVVYIGDIHQLASRFVSVQAFYTHNSGYADFLKNLQRKADMQLDDEPNQFGEPAQFCTSFTRFYQQVQRMQGKLAARVDNSFA